MRKNNHHIPKSLLVINNIIIVIACIAFIIGFIFFVNYLFEVDKKYTKTEATNLNHLISRPHLITDCYIPNGKYKTIYDDQFSHYGEFEFQLTKDSLLTKDKNFKIERFDAGGFIKINDFKVTDSTTELQKKLMEYGKFSYFQIKKCDGNKFKFIEGPNLHVISSSGTFIKY